VPLRQRPEDIYLLFRKFARDFAEKYRMPPLRLDDEARILLENYRWPGNVRQLKNITEQISIIEQNREITSDILQQYLPSITSKNLPALLSRQEDKNFSTEREILYKILFDMKRDMNDLKKLVLDMMGNNEMSVSGDHSRIIQNLYDAEPDLATIEKTPKPVPFKEYDRKNIQDTEEVIEESLSLEDKEIELITKALEKHHGKRKHAASELGISERTLYRKIKEHDIKG
jgi:DNA-binding NtrC family response regulator